jgi:hypothetical protein
MWKERNRRTFESKSATPRAVVELIREDVNYFELASKF